jgi:hypothetical protein
VSFRTVGFARLTDSLSRLCFVRWVCKGLESTRSSILRSQSHWLTWRLCPLHRSQVRCFIHFLFRPRNLPLSAAANSAGSHRDHSTIASKSGTSTAPAKPIRLQTSSHPTPQHPNHPSTLLPRTSSDTLLLRDHRNVSSDYGTPEPANVLANSSDIPTIFALFLFQMMPAT